MADWVPMKVCCDFGWEVLRLIHDHFAKFHDMVAKIIVII